MNKWSSLFQKPTLTCTRCDKEIAEGERFLMESILPKEKEMIVGRFDVACARTAQHVWCENCLTVVKR